MQVAFLLVIYFYSYRQPFCGASLPHGIRRQRKDSLSRMICTLVTHIYLPVTWQHKHSQLPHNQIHHILRRMDRRAAVFQQRDLFAELLIEQLLQEHQVAQYPEIFVQFFQGFIPAKLLGRYVEMPD